MIANLTDAMIVINEYDNTIKELRSALITKQAKAQRLRDGIKEAMGMLEKSEKYDDGEWVREAYDKLYQLVEGE